MKHDYEIAKTITNSDFFGVKGCYVLDCQTKLKFFNFSNIILLFI